MPTFPKLSFDVWQLDDTPGIYLVRMQFNNMNALYYEMSRDAHMPNGVCISIQGPEYCPTAYGKMPLEDIPVGIVRMIINLVRLQVTVQRQIQEQFGTSPSPTDVVVDGLMQDAGIQ